VVFGAAFGLAFGKPEIISGFGNLLILRVWGGHRRAPWCGFGMVSVAVGVVVAVVVCLAAGGSGGSGQCPAQDSLHDVWRILTVFALTWRTSSAGFSALAQSLCCSCAVLARQAGVTARRQLVNADALC
jgi:hypothetical protein